MHCTGDWTTLSFVARATTTAGRQKVGNNAVAFRIHNFSLRLTAQEIDAYSQLAEENGVPVSEWMRNVLNAEVRYKEELASLPAKRGANFLAQTGAVERSAVEYYDAITRYLGEKEKERKS
jgi:hypothetical protein